MQSITDDRYADGIRDDSPPPAVVKTGPGRWIYRDYHIVCDPPPIPSRSADYQFWPDDLCCPKCDSDRCGYGPTVDDCIDQIDEILNNQNKE